VYHDATSENDCIVQMSEINKQMDMICMVKLTTTNGNPFTWRSQVLAAHSIMQTGEQMYDMAQEKMLNVLKAQEETLKVEVHPEFEFTL
jgi:glutamine synthetase